MPDSLIRALETTYDEEERLKLLWKIVKKTFQIPEYDTTLYFAGVQERLAKKSKNQKMFANAIWAKSMVYREKGNLRITIKYLIEAHDLYKELKDKRKVPIALYNVGQIFFEVNDIENALFYLRQALKENRKSKNGIFSAAIHYEIARCLIEVADYEKSLFNLRQCIKINDIKINPGLTSKAHNYLGVNYYKLKEYDQAIIEYKRSRELAVGLKDYNLKSAISHNNIGEVYIEKKDYQSARMYYEKALILKRELDNKELLAGTLINLAKLDLLENKPSSAISHLEEIVHILDKNRISKNLKEASLLLNQAYKSKQNLTSGDLQKIIDLNEQYAQLINELKEAEFQQSILSTILKNELRSEAVYLGEKVDKVRHFSLWLACFCLLVIIGFSILLYYQKQKFKSFVNQMWQDIKDI